MGLLDLGKSFLGALGINSGDPYKHSVNAAEKAKTESQALGQKLWDQQMQGLGSALGYYGGADQAFQNLSNQGPGQLEQFYASQLGGAANPYWDRRMQESEKALNAQMAARGGFNSGGAYAALGNQRGAMEGERFGQMGQLASGAQQATQARLGNVFQAGMGLGGAKAGLTSDFYGRGGAMQQQQGENAINSGIAAGGYRTQGGLADQAGFRDLIKMGIGFASGAAGGGGLSGGLSGLGAGAGIPQPGQNSGLTLNFGGGGGYGGQGGGRNPLYPWTGGGGYGVGGRGG